MAILFEWYENPVAPGKPVKKRFHARIIYNGKVSTKELRAKIQQRCTQPIYRPMPGYYGRPLDTTEEVK